MRTVSLATRETDRTRVQISDLEGAGTSDIEALISGKRALQEADLENEGDRIAAKTQKARHKGNCQRHQGLQRTILHYRNGGEDMQREGAYPHRENWPSPSRRSG